MVIKPEHHSVHGEGGAITTAPLVCGFDTRLFISR